jgi:uncharacterized protein YcbK (DUF882 family)
LDIAIQSPHFRLKQFLCKQNGGYPKYLVLKEALPPKMELILQRLNAKGYRCDSFHVMSGYRTPYYNKAIGNVKYSRHIYGGAADIFIDELYGKSYYIKFMGGLARYKKTLNHDPFVHLDVRGRRARWGD